MDPTSYLVRKALKGTMGAVWGTYQKAQRDRAKAPDSGDVELTLFAGLTGHTKGPGKYQGAAVYSVDCAPAGSIIATGGADGTVRLWSIEAPAAARQILRMTPSIRSVAFARDGRLAIGASDKRLYVTAPVGSGEAAVRTTQTFYLKKPLMRVAWSPDDELVAAYLDTGEVSIWDAAGRHPEILMRRRLGEFVPSPDLKFTPSGDRISYVTYDSVASLTTAGVKAERVRAVARVRVTGFDYSPDGKQIAMGIEKGTISVCDWPTGTVRQVLRSHDHFVIDASVPAVAYSPDGTRLASGGYDGVLKIWRATDGALQASRHCNSGPIHALRWTPDSRRIVAATNNGGAQVWSVNA